MASFYSKLRKFDSNLWGYHIIVPVELASNYIEGTERRVICTLQNSYSFSCGLIPAGDGNYFININKDIRKLLSIKLGDNIELDLVKDTSRYGMPLSEEFEEVLSQDPPGKKYFESITAGKRRTLIHMVNKLKNPDKRIRKSLIIMDHLKRNKGLLSFKALMNDFKLR